MGAIAVMVANALIEIAWICATVFLVINDHHYWAIATFIAALISGYSATGRKKAETNSST